jgi:predicted secreted Zn-dependent protease
MLTADVWNASEAYHAVSGRNPNELITSTVAAAASVCTDHPGALACAGPTIWSIEPNAGYNPVNGVCSISNTIVDAEYAAYLPQWTSPSQVPAELLAWWRLVLEHIRWHEEQHIRIFVDYTARLPSLLSDELCSVGQEIINTWNAELMAAQDAFDAGDRSWQYPPYSGPWQW